MPSLPAESPVRFGEYTITERKGSGPAGPIYATTDSSLDVYSLAIARDNPRVWAVLTRRLSLVGILNHPACLRPITSDLNHDPPYIVLPSSRPLATAFPASQFGVIVAELTSFLSEAHRLGLTLGKADRTSLRITNAGRLVLDVTGTAMDRSMNAIMDESEPVDDIAWLGRQIHALFEPSAIDRETQKILERMQSESEDDRPTTEEIAARFRPVDPSMTMATEVGSDMPVIGGLAETSETGTPPAPESLPMPQVGDRLGRFVLLEKVGEGGVGIVFRAEDASDGSIVAIKVLRANSRTSETARRRFIKEARLLGAIDTPFVTRLIEANSDGGHLYMALEFIAGQSVGDLLREAGRLDEPTALGLIADAARGLAAAHARGIVHRDMKPDNLMIAQFGANRRVKVSDFGLARPIVQTDSLEVTRAGSVLGTPLYMAPEQFGNAMVGPQADVYSLGATLFHMLAGRPPFPADNLAALARAVANEPPPALDRVAPGTSAAVAALVDRCLSKDPLNRPTDAEAFLVEVERLRNGEPADLNSHPRLPTGSRSVVEYVHSWKLSASPIRLWPYVSNTERLNRAAGLPSVRYEIRRDERGGTRRFATARVGGMSMEWEEHPFEWVEGRRMGVLREFTRGPFVWFISIVELIPAPGGGTFLRQTLRAEPRNLLGRIAARIELGLKSGRSLGRVYRRIDAILSAHDIPVPTDDPFEVPTRLTGPRQRLLGERIARLVGHGVPRDSADLLGLFVSNAPEQEAARIRPIALARQFGLDESAIIDACLRAVGEGILELKWDLICPLCRIPSGRRDTLRELKEHENCAACDQSFATDFAAAVEAVFRVHPDIRRVEPGTYCAGGPAHSPHVVAQTRLSPGERIELELPLSDGLYQVRGPQLVQKADLRIDSNSSIRRWDIDLSTMEAPPRLAAGGIVLGLKNTTSVGLIVRIERSAPRDDALTAARAVAMPAFRDLFPGELLSPGQLAPASVVTFLAVEIEDGMKLFETVGENQAFQLIQSAFRSMEATIRSEGGVVLKSIGTGIIATFADVAAGVRAAFLLPDALRKDATTRSLQLKMAVHRGLAYVVTLNDRLDYFGQAPLITQQFIDAARGQELVLSSSATNDPSVEALLRGRSIRLAEVKIGDHGRRLVHHVQL